MRIPFLAPWPVAIIIAVGVASPRAHGQAMTSTEIKIVMQKSLLSPAIFQPTAAIIASKITAGTKYAEITSASLAIGAFLPCASSTSLIICEIAVSSPIFSAVYSI